VGASSSARHDRAAHCADRPAKRSRGACRWSPAAQGRAALVLRSRPHGVPHGAATAAPLCPQLATLLPQCLTHGFASPATDGGAILSAPGPIWFGRPSRARLERRAARSPLRAPAAQHAVIVSARQPLTEERGRHADVVRWRPTRCSHGRPSLPPARRAPVSAPARLASPAPPWMAGPFPTRSFSRASATLEYQLPRRGPRDGAKSPARTRAPLVRGSSEMRQVSS
jgi:hypothetical protein